MESFEDIIKLYYTCYFLSAQINLNFGENLPENVIIIAMGSIEIPTYILGTGLNIQVLHNMFHFPLPGERG